MTSKKIVIVGGGTSGLAAAHALKKRGLEPLVLEANVRPGGRLGGDRAADFSLDEGADFCTASHDVALRLCDEFGLRMNSLVGNFSWYRKGRFTATYVDSSRLRSLVKSLPALWLLEFLTPRGIRSMTRLLREVQKHRDYLSFASDSRLVEIDGDENAADFMARIGVHKELEIAIRGFLQMTMMGRLEQIGAMCALTYFGEIMMKTEHLRVPEHGMGSLTRALAESCGEALRVSAPVRRIDIEDGAATRVLLDDGALEATAVICTTTATKALELMPGLPDEIRAPLRRVVYSHSCRIVMGLDYHPLPTGLYGVLYPEDDTLLLDRSISLPACMPPGKATLELLVGCDRAAQVIPMGDDEIVRELMRDVRRRIPAGTRLPDDGEAIFTRVYRWPEALCLAPPGMLKAIADMRREHAGKVKNLFLAGDYTRVPSVNGALASGIEAAEEAAQYVASLPD